MARAPRIQVANGVYHVGTRGVERRPIFGDDADRVCFVAMLKRITRRLDWTCHVYCLMTNHYHLVVGTAKPNISRGMQWLNGFYAEGFNDRYAREGHLFERRFWSEIIEGDESYENRCRYVLLNPVRAGLCELAEEWPWSGGSFLDDFRRRASPGERLVL